MQRESSIPQAEFHEFFHSFCLCRRKKTGPSLFRQSCQNFGDTAKLLKIILEVTFYIAEFFSNTQTWTATNSLMRRYRTDFWIQGY